MIVTLTELIRKNNWLHRKDAELSFMKASTPASGSKAGNGKVIIFVFEKGRKTPTLCVKTTRVYAAGNVIKQNYEGLTRLKEMVRGSENDSLFTEPLHIYDDGKVIFYIESVFPGERFSARGRDMDFVIQKYIAWQKEIKKEFGKILYLADIDKMAFDAIASLQLSQDSVTALRKYYECHRPSPKIELPVIIQHGDMTPDNVLVSKDKVCLVDYDYVGLFNIPGFDLYHFFLKTKSRNMTLLDTCQKYLPEYFKSIGANVENFDALLFVYYLIESVRKGTGGKNGDEVIAAFESLLKK